MDITYNFKARDDGSSSTGGKVVDTRHDIMCVGPTYDWNCYLNYIDYLNSNKAKWKNNGYLDLGMMPIVMAPSFMQAQMVDAMVKLMSVCKIECHSMPPVSLFFNKNNMMINDIWAFKSDVARVTGIPEDKLTLEKLIRWCGVK